MTVITLAIDGRSVQVESGATILDAARKLGIDVPTLCHRPGYAANTSCMACVVRVNGQNRLLPACATPAGQGMIVESESPQVRLSRKIALELLLADHAGDCQAPCTNVCPAHMDIPSMIRHIEAGRMRDAIVTIKDKIALPAVLGRICPELCEKGCRRGLKDQPVSICQLKRHAADVDLASPEPYLPSCLPDSGKKIAVIGAGPAGLAAAWYLAQQGHACVLIDQHPLAGGNLRYAIDRALLPEAVLDAEINLIRKLGVQFQPGQRVGQDISLPDLRRQFDAVLIAVGAIDATGAALLGIELLGNGLKIDKQTMMTSLPGVFATGAALTPYRHAIRAVGAGRLAADAITSFLAGRPIALEYSPFSVRLGVLDIGEKTTFLAGSTDDARVASFPAGLSSDQAITESARCLSCDCGKLQECSLRRWASAYGAEPGHYRMPRRPFHRTDGPRIPCVSAPAQDADETVVYESGKCIACGMCVQITAKAREPLGLSFIGRGFQVRIAGALDAPLTESLRKVAQECVSACPTGALALRKH